MDTAKGWVTFKNQRSRRNINILEWPSQSSDLNPIEIYFSIFCLVRPDLSKDAGEMVFFPALQGSFISSDSFFLTAREDMKAYYLCHAKLTRQLHSNTTRTTINYFIHNK